MIPEEYCTDCDAPIYPNQGRYRLLEAVKCELCGDRYENLKKEISNGTNKIQYKETIKGGYGVYPPHVPLDETKNQDCA